LQCIDRLTVLRLVEFLDPSNLRHRPVDQAEVAGDDGDGGSNRLLIGKLVASVDNPSEY
jgi:hypothetical protein